MSGRVRAAGILVLAITVLLAVSCARLSDLPAATDGIPAETLASRSTVPAEWGSLVSVSSVAEYPELVQLWFQGDDGTVRYAVVSLRSHEILNAHAVRRGQEVAP